MEVKKYRPRTYGMMFHDGMDGTNIVVRLNPRQRWTLLEETEQIVKLDYKNVVMRIRRSDFDRMWKEI